MSFSEPMTLASVRYYRAPIRDSQVQMPEMPNIAFSNDFLTGIKAVRVEGWVTVKAFTTSLMTDDVVVWIYFLEFLIPFLCLFDGGGWSSLSSVAAFVSNGELLELDRVSLPSTYAAFSMSIAET